MMEYVNAKLTPTLAILSTSIRRILQTLPTNFGSTNPFVLVSIVGSGSGGCVAVTVVVDMLPAPPITYSP